MLSNTLNAWRGANAAICIKKARIPVCIFHRNVSSTYNALLKPWDVIWHTITTNPGGRCLCHVANTRNAVLRAVHWYGKPNCKLWSMCSPCCQHSMLLWGRGFTDSKHNTQHNGHMFLCHVATTRNAVLGECALIWHACFFATWQMHKAVLGSMLRV